MRLALYCSAVWWIVTLLIALACHKAIIADLRKNLNETLQGVLACVNDTGFTLQFDNPNEYVEVDCLVVPNHRDYEKYGIKRIVAWKDEQERQFERLRSTRPKVGRLDISSSSKSKQGAPYAP